MKGENGPRKDSMLPNISFWIVFLQDSVTTIKSYLLLSTYHGPGIVQNAFHTVPLLILPPRVLHR